MSYEVALTKSASRDLEEIYDYIELHDGRRPADDLLNALEEGFASLESLPNRGTVPNELEELGIMEFREIFFKPYRIIYEVTEKQVIVYLIADGRREMRALLERRLLRDP